MKHTLTHLAALRVVELSGFGQPLVAAAAVAVRATSDVGLRIEPE